MSEELRNIFEGWAKEKYPEPKVHSGGFFVKDKGDWINPENEKTQTTEQLLIHFLTNVYSTK